MPHTFNPAVSVPFNRVSALTSQQGSPGGPSPKFSQTGTALKPTSLASLGRADLKEKDVTAPFDAVKHIAKDGRAYLKLDTTNTHTAKAQI